MYQGHQNSGPRTSDWMAQAYRPSKNIYLLGIQPHYFLIGKSHDGEGFVDLKEVNIGEFHPCSLQCQWNGICGAVVNHSGALAELANPLMTASGARFSS